MQEHEHEEHQHPVELSFLQKAAVFVPGAATAIGLDALLHAPLPLAVAGVIGAFYLARNSPELYAMLRKQGPEPKGQAPANTRGACEWTLTDRLLGKHYTQHTVGEQEEEGLTEEGNEDDETISLDTTVDAAQEPIPLPIAPPFLEMCRFIQADRLVLCWTHAGPLYGTVKDLLSMVIIGKPGRGKTTALIYYVAMLLKAGAEVHVWDPHGSMSELDGAFEQLHYTDELEDIAQSIATLRTDLEVRRRLYKKDKSVKHPLLLLVDELPVIGEYNKSLLRKGVEENQTPVKLISDVVLQARKWNCYFIGAGQSTDADILPTRVTENLSSRIAFYSSNRRATMAGIDLETAKRFLPVLKPDEVQGRMIFDCSRLSEPLLGAIPNTTITDVHHFLGASAPVERVQPSQPTKLDDLTLEDLLTLIGRMKDVDPDDRRYGEPPHAREPKEECQQESVEEKALRVYRQGHISLDAFAAALNMGRDKTATRSLWQRTKFLAAQAG